MKDIIRMNHTHIRYVLTLLHLLAVSVVAFLLWDTSKTFIHPESFPGSILEELPYFLPAVFLLVLVRLGWYHERFEGIALVASGFLFLPLFRVSLSIGIFLALFLLGMLFLIDDSRHQLSY